LGAGIADLILLVQRQELQQVQALQLQQEQEPQLQQQAQEPLLALPPLQVPLFLQVLLLLRLYYSQTIKPSQPSLSL
jgi:hypothetical protein